ncbi:XdhC family protein [Variovorax sp. OV700]|uniref:XdhC family protein n=1 Tax=Variovorax sp. OV700 TaxID=1882826 RepID=UPI000B82EDF6|nr:XdhC family protein [Variovorax sp. OV700]
MENLDVKVLRTLHGWRRSGKRALLATVVRTWGSSPRPVGSIMALCEDGAVVGSISGGCIEDDLIHRFTTANAGKDEIRSLPLGPPIFIRYGVTAEEAHRFGLPCGGTLELLLEYDPDAISLGELVQGLEQGQLMRRTVRLSDGTVTLDASPGTPYVNATEVVNTFGPEYRMLLIGAGQLTEYLATMGLFSGFAVTVCDPREQYRGGWNVPGAQMLTGMPDDVVMAFKPDRRSCIVALTHDPKLDDLALLEALNSKAFYIGAIGSRRNNAARRQRMIDHFAETEESLARLRGPIGLYIGSKTPAEIAVSVMAEILAVKNEVILPQEMDVARAKDGGAPRSSDVVGDHNDGGVAE